MKILISLLLIIFVHSVDDLASNVNIDDLYDPVRISNAIMSLKEEYPEATPWTEDNTYRWDGKKVSDTIGKSYINGYGCAAFAMMASDVAFGKETPVYKFFDKDEIRIGDVLEVEYPTFTHFFIVVEDLGNYRYRVAEGNCGSAVRYGRIYDLNKGSLKEGYTRYPPK